MDIAIDQLALILQQYPWIKTFLAAFFCLRIVNKVVFSILHKYVQLTKTTKDNKLYKKITESTTYKMISFILDMGLSIKLPK